MRAAHFITTCGLFLVNATPLVTTPIVGGMRGPSYLGIKDVDNCLSRSQGICVPEKKPAECLDQSWKQLNSLEGIEKVKPCTPPPPPPKYTTIMDYDKCIEDLDSKIPCLPYPRPSACCEDSWNKLKALSGADKLRPCIDIEVPVRMNPPSPPKYTTIKDYSKCIENPDDKSKACLQIPRPSACCEDSWNKLNALSGADMLRPCVHVDDPIRINPPSPPKYTTIKDYSKCIENPDDKSKACLQIPRPSACCEDSWNKLNALSGADKLRPCVHVDDPIRINPPSPPKYTTIKDYSKCIENPDDKKNACLQFPRPSACCEDSWNKIKALSGADKLRPCVHVDVPILIYPNSPSNFRSDDFLHCLKTYYTGTSYSWCLPDKKSTACSDQLWDQLAELPEAEKFPACKKE